MPVPAEITAALESVIDIYFSSVRHRERAAFILCDNLVEMACKTKAREHNYRANMQCGFHDALLLPGVTVRSTLARRLESNRSTRNNMQHGSAAATVDAEHCAKAILDAVKVIDHCWPNSSANHFPAWIRCALRVVRLYSSGDNPLAKNDFESHMRSAQWRVADRETVKVNCRQIEMGNRDHWGLAIRTQATIVEDCLTRANVP